MWSDIAGCPGYQVSSDGAVRSMPRLVVDANSRWGGPMVKRMSGRALKTWETNSGYLMVMLGAGRGKKRYVHRLVAEAFIPVVVGRDVVNHLDGDRHNNRSRNLEWGTHSTNMLHSHYVLGNRGGQFGAGRTRYAAGAHV